MEKCLLSTYTKLSFVIIYYILKDYTENTYQKKSVSVFILNLLNY